MPTNLKRLTSSSSPPSPTESSKRLEANKKERMRVQKMNNAFQDLRRVLPKCESQTKIDLLSSAKKHIEYLTAQLQTHLTGSENQVELSPVLNNYQASSSFYKGQDFSDLYAVGIGVDISPYIETRDRFMLQTIGKQDPIDPIALSRRRGRCFAERCGPEPSSVPNISSLQTLHPIVNNITELDPIVNNITELDSIINSITELDPIVNNITEIGPIVNSITELDPGGSVSTSLLSHRSADIYGNGFDNVSLLSVCLGDFRQDTPGGVLEDLDNLIDELGTDYINQESSHSIGDPVESYTFVNQFMNSDRLPNIM
ncbi:uncharacterized protein LOC116614959 [Nematostella vectensis]|uniref:uncharacterized protein LOC116614959 n=1 Tax=Nematostella vectensis TaxID=45351 RepID=UPI00138FD342|nr:uncharacterized protein LOC116614959 [Nematostella vectensis]